MPKGIDIAKADFLQKELVRVCSYLKPNYTPIIYFEKYFGNMDTWGHERPYSAPATLGKDKEYKYFIRKFSSNVVPQNDELKELLSLTASVPFDDRVNHHASR